MKHILITGGRGFLGRNLAAHLRERKDCEIAVSGRETSLEDFRSMLLRADIVFHLAAVNRPDNPAEFEQVNRGLTERMCRMLLAAGRSPKIVFSSSIQVAIDNPYGASKAHAEKALLQFAEASGAPVRIYRLKNLFGKWSRPNYNSVTATLCHNIARDLPTELFDPGRMLDLSYVDDVAEAFMAELDTSDAPDAAVPEIPGYRIEVAELAGRIQAFHEMRSTLVAPDFSDGLNRALYATYLSCLPEEARSSTLEIKSDARGSLAEFIKEPHFGQIFVSRTRPGVTRGNHYHHTKTEKFFVVEGSGLIRMRSIEGGPIKEYPVQGGEYRVIDIPPGFTHSITNIGTGEMVTLFWSSEIFNPDRPDTYFLPVDFESPAALPALEHA